MEFIYYAKRSIQVAHTLGNQYVIDIDVVDDYSTSIKGKRIESLAGNTVTIIHNDEEYLNIRTENVNGSTTPSIADMREFLNSVKAGEIFSLNGTNASLISITAPYTETRLGNSDYYSYSFKVRT